MASTAARPASVADFRNTAGIATADWSWDEAHLDPWLANPQAVIPGAFIPDQLGKPEARTVIIGYLKDLHGWLDPSVP